MMRNSQWFINLNGNNIGPLSTNEVLVRLKEKSISPSTRVWREGFPSWIPLGNSDFLSSSTRTNPPIEIYGGFWQRVLASIIDTSIVTPINMMILFAATGGSSYYATDLFSYEWILSWCISSIVGICYFGILQSKLRATPGKFAVGLRLVDENFQPISVSVGLIRYFVLFLGSIPFGAGLIAAGFSQRKQGWHDMVAKTLVVKSSYINEVGSTTPNTSNENKYEHFDAA